MTFEDLTSGDRFTAYGALWTKLSTSTARKHSADGQALGANGYGYVGDSLCTFEPTDRVEFVPVPT